MLSRLLRSIAFSAITTCIVASGYAAEKVNPVDSVKTGGELADDISASLVICGRGTRLFSSFGHSSIHMSCPSANLDNYYTFLIQATPDNIWRFFSKGISKGHFEAQKYEQFAKDYLEQNRPITEYKLNLTTDEVRHLWMNLDKETYNAVSRVYTLLHSQCTSISADVIRHSLLNERIEYGELPPVLDGTMREFAENAVSDPWYLFGFQSILGKEGEQKGTVWEKLTPTTIQPIWSKASIVNASGKRRPVLIGEPNVLFNGTFAPDEPSPFTPLVVFSIILAFTILLTMAECFTRKLRGVTKVYDAILLCVQTLLGVFFCGLLFFSEATWMKGNVLPIVFNPLPAILWLSFQKKKWFRWVYLLYAFVLAAMIVATPFVPQLQWSHSLLFAIFLVRVVALFIQKTSTNNSSQK